MSKVIKKVNVLLDEPTFRAFMTIAGIRNESSTKILRPAIEKYIKDNQESAVSTFTSSLTQFSNLDSTIKETSKVATTTESITTEETEEHFRIYAQIAQENPDLIIVADNGEKYLAQSKILKQALISANLPIISVTKVGHQPVINGKKSTKKLFKLR